MSLRIRQSTKFRRDIKRLSKQGFDLSKLETVVKVLVAEEPLAEKYRDHPLTGNWVGYRDCHIQPDWLLIYRIVEDEYNLPEPVAMPSCLASSTTGVRSYPVGSKHRRGDSTIVLSLLLLACSKVIRNDTDHLWGIAATKEFASSGCCLVNPREEYLTTASTMNA